MKKYNNKKINGFTIMELILVVTLLMLLGATVLTTMGISGTQLDVAAKRVREDIEYAQDLSMIQGAPFGFYAQNLSSYEIYESVPGSAVLDPLTHADMSINLTSTYHVIYFASLPPQIEFDSSGVPNITGNNQILLTDGKNTKTLTMNTVTGNITGP